MILGIVAMMLADAGGEIVDGAGSAAGVGAASGVGAKIAAAAGLAAGIGAANADGEDGAAISSGAGSAIGAGAAAAIATATAASPGSSTGAGAASATGEAITPAVGAAAGAGAGSAVGEIAVFYTTLNPADKHADITLSNGDLTAVSGSAGNWRSVRSVAAMDATTDKIHIEVTIDDLSGNSQGLMVGIADAGAAILANYLGSVDDSLGYQTNFAWWGGQTGGGGIVAPTTGDVIIIEIDGPNREVKLAKNTGSYATAAALSGTNLDDDTNWYFAISIFTTSIQATVNFGSSAWVKAPTSGFTGLL